VVRVVRGDFSPLGTALGRRALRSWPHVHGVRCCEDTSLYLEAAERREVTSDDADGADVLSPEESAARERGREESPCVSCLVFSIAKPPVDVARCNDT